MWFTGLSGAGKSTIASGVYEEVRSGTGRCELLDGDVLRNGLCSDLGFSKRDRHENVRRIGIVAELLSRHGIMVLIAAIAPYRESRNEVRKTLPHFIEVYVDAPLAVCESRDPKGLYRKVRAGQLPSFTGIDDPYEEPLAPNVHCFTNDELPRQSVKKVMEYLDRYREVNNDK